MGRSRPGAGVADLRRRGSLAGLRAPGSGPLHTPPGPALIGRRARIDSDKDGIVDHHHPARGCGQAVRCGLLSQAAFTCAPRGGHEEPPGAPDTSGLASGRQMAACAPAMMQLTKQPRACAPARDAPGAWPPRGWWRDAARRGVTRSAIGARAKEPGALEGALEIGDSGGAGGGAADLRAAAQRACACLHSRALVGRTLQESIAR